MPWQVTQEIINIAEKAYREFTRAGTDWLALNPGGSLTTLVTGFSRGAGPAALFTQMVYERGLTDPDTGAVLVAPGEVGSAGALMFEPVLTGANGNMGFAPNTQNITVVRALDEFRTLFPAADYNDPRVNYVDFFGNHGDIGGFYDQGLGALTLEGATAYFRALGLPIDDVPPERAFDPSRPVVIHTEVVDEYGNVLWDEYGTRGNRLTAVVGAPPLLQTMGDGSSVAVFTLYDGRVLRQVTDSEGNLTTTIESGGGTTLQNAIGQYGGTLLDALSLLKAIQSGEPLPLLVSGLRLANDLSTLNGSANLNVSGLANVGGSLLSLLALDAALERGDNLGAITAGAQAVSFAATAYTEFISASYGDAINAAADGYGAAFDAASGLSEALPYLNLINSIANGDETGVAVAAMSMMGVPYIGWAYAVYSLIDGLFGGEDIPDPWGTGEFVWAGSGVGVSAVGETGGQEAVTGVMSATLNTLNALIEQVRTQNPGSELGLIAQRLPSVAYDMSGYRFTNIDPLTGVEQHPALRFDTQGNPYNAVPGSPQSYQSIVEGTVRSALQRGAIAPQWEVRTAQMQTQAGDPRAGLSEEERAGRDGQLAAPLAGTTQVFRPVVLDLDGDGIETTAQAEGVAFDVDDSGYLKQTAWVKGDDAMLVLDRDYNGQFDSGRELFSNATVSLNRRGLAGMGWVDANHDGKLNAADPVWDELKLWRDLDQDGTQDVGEVQTLDALGVNELDHAMGTFTQNGMARQLASPNLQADKDGTRVTVVPEGILVQASEDGRISLVVTRITDKTAVQANRDGVTGFEDTELIVSAADLLANDTLGGIAGRDLTITGLTNFRHGTGFLDSNGFIHFTPEANHAGDDAGFDYVTQAANGQTGTGTVDITLQGVNDAPTLDAVSHVTRPVYGYMPVIIYSDSESGFSQYAGGGEPIYQPYGIRRDDFGDSGSVETVVLNPPPGQWNIEYHTTPLGQEDSGAGRVVGADVDDPATSLRYEVLNQPQFGSVSLQANGQFQYTSWKEPGVASDRIVYQGQYAGLKDGTLYYPGNLPAHALYPTTDVFQVRITDPSGASTVASIQVPHYGPYLPSTPVGGGGKKPIALDLDGNGFEFVNVNDSTVFFDVNGDGWRRRTAWAAPTDGLLAYDIDGDGKIDQAGEIGFAHYKEGAQTDLEGLGAFDSNGDGMFNAADAKWSSFGVWQDANQNGETDAGEFRRLGEMGVTGVRLTSDGRFEVINGQTIHGVGAMTLADGSELAMADVTLAYSDETRVVMPDGSVTNATPSNFSPDGKQLLGTDGNDLILGKNGNNIVQGYAGDDVILEDGGNDLIDGGDGNDTIYAGADNDVVQAGSGDDAMFAGLGDDLVFGGEGNDAILAEGGNDVVFGGDGNDLIAGGWGNDVLSGDDGNDQLLGESGNDALFGRDGDDELQGMDGNDLLDGGNGNDLLDGGSGVDQLLGGMGDDTYTVDDVADVVVEWADAGTDIVRTNLNGYVLGEHIENLVLLGTLGLTGTGNTADNGLTGNVGNNLLLDGAGNDRLDGGLGADSLAGGIGDDVYWVDDTGDAIVEQEGEGIDTVRSSISHSLAAHVEHLVLTGIQATDGTGNGLDNLLTGNTSNNLLDGGLGADTMLGGRGNDTYWVDNPGDVVLENADEGLDTVVSQIDHTLAAHVENLVLWGVADLRGTGNELNNTLSGNSGDNLLDGGVGADTLVGGLGDDTYVVDNAADAVVENADAGSDHVLASVSHVLANHIERLTLTGSAHIDGVGNDLANQMQGNDGNNRLDGAAGADTLAGGAGDDTYVVDNAGDQVLEWFGAGQDTVLSSISFVLPADVENLVLMGSAPIDGTGNELNNRLTGNAANNVLDGGAGDDVMAGGDGDDTYVVDSANDTALEWAQGGADTVRSSVGFVLPEHVENLILTGWADTRGTGNALDNLLRGNAGNNGLAGLAGDDVLQGGDGHDTLDGGLGQDHLLGGRGDDRYLFRTGDGLDHIDDEQGTDTVVFGVGLSVDNVALRITQANGIATAHIRILNSGGCEQQNQGLDFSLQKNASGQWASTIERFEFSDGNVRTLDDLLIKARVTEGSSRQTELITGRDDDVIYAGPRTDTIRAGSGHDVVFASSGGDLAYGEGGDDYLQGDTGDDLLDGGCGTDVLSGSNGQDRLLGGGGNDALLGGHQRDILDGGDGNDFLAGGKHDDTLWTGSGYNVIAFNQGDGRDIVQTTVGSSNALSLGGGIREQDLTLAKSGNDLVLSAGSNSQITFKDWYASPTQQTLSTLQLVKSVDSTASGWSISTYDFKALVQSFDVARQANSSNWSLTNRLLDAHLAIEERAAWGGELAVRYSAGGESALSLEGAQNTLSQAAFAVQAQEVGSRFNPSMGSFQIH